MHTKLIEIDLDPQILVFIIRFYENGGVFLNLIHKNCVRGRTGHLTYVLNGHLTYNDTVQVQAGIDTIVKFYFNIPAGASGPTGTYTFYITVWTDWPSSGGICVDYIVDSFIVE